MADSVDNSFKLLRNIGLSLAIIPASMFPFFIYFALEDPSFVFQEWEIYGLLFGLPWALSALIFNSLRKNRK